MRLEIKMANGMWWNTSYIDIDDSTDEVRTHDDQGHTVIVRKVRV